MRFFKVIISIFLTVLCCSNVIFAQNYKNSINFAGNVYFHGDTRYASLFDSVTFNKNDDDVYAWTSKIVYTKYKKKTTIPEMMKPLFIKGARGKIFTYNDKDVISIATKTTSSNVILYEIHRYIQNNGFIWDVALYHKVPIANKTAKNIEDMNPALARFNNTCVSEIANLTLDYVGGISRQSQ